MPRYLRPLAPPPTILNKQEPGQQQAEAVAWSVLQNQFSALDGNQRFDFRFVSLIPHTATNAYFPGLGDVWPTSEQFLRMMVGTKSYSSSYVVLTKARHPGGHRGRARRLTYELPHRPGQDHLPRPGQGGARGQNRILPHN